VGDGRLLARVFRAQPVRVPYTGTSIIYWLTILITTPRPQLSSLSRSFLYSFLFVSRPLYATAYISQMSNSITRFDNLTELFLQSQKCPLTLRR